MLEKRKMLTFSAATRIAIETIASGVLLFCAYKLFGGVLENSQTETGTYILLAFAVIFAAGGIAGLIKCFVKYNKLKKDRSNT